MRLRRIVIIVTAGALVVGGAGAAIAATSSDDGRDAERSILQDAAKRLDRSPAELRAALAAAQDAQLDRAVEDGEITRKQADALKRFRRESGSVLGMHPRGPHGPGGLGPHVFMRPGGPGGPGGLLSDVAKALDMRTETLFEQLRDGRSLAAIARARDKSLDDVKAAVRSAARARFDESVEDGDITRRQADRMLDHLEEHLDHLGQRRGFGPPRLRRAPGPAPRGLALPVPPPPGVPG